MFNNEKHENKHYTYSVFKEELRSEDLGTYISYGICAKDCNGKILSSVSDISTEYEEVKKLALRCEEGQLDPSQLQDVAEDFLVELTTV